MPKEGRMPMKLTPPRRLRNLPLNMLAPNILTIIALCSVLTAIRFALLEQWKFAVVAVAIAALFDMMDGRVARLPQGSLEERRVGKECVRSLDLVVRCIL